MKYIISLILLLSGSTFAQEYLIKNRTHQITVIPETMEVKIKTGINNWYSISAAQDKSSIDIIHNSSNGITWYNRKHQSTFSLNLVNNKVNLKIDNPENSRIVWPRIESNNKTEALIWPGLEGLWIPFKSSKGVDYLRNNELPVNRKKFWGINLKNKTLTYIQDSTVRTFHYLSKRGPVIEFFQNESNVNLSIILTHSASPIEPALIYKDQLKNSKILKTPLPKEFLGSPVIYMKGKEYITADDLIPGRVQDFCRKVAAESRLVTTPSFKLKRAILGMKEWSFITDGAQLNNPDEGAVKNIANSLSKVISAINFHSDSISENSIFLYNSFRDYLYPIETWGSGESLGVITRLKDLNIDKCIVLTEHIMSKEMLEHTSKLGYFSGLEKSIIGITNEPANSAALDWSLQLPLINAIYRENYIVVSAHDTVPGNKTRILKQLLYMQAPLFPMDSNSTRDENQIIKEVYDLSSSIHSRFGSSPMVSFDYLSGSGLIQRAVYQGGLAVVANYSKIECTYMDYIIPPESVLIKTPEEVIIY